MKIMSRDFSTTHRQQLSQGWRISVLHLGPQGVSYSFCGVRSRAQILLFQNASYSLNYISVGSWGPLTSLSSMFLPEESLYVDWLVHYDTKDHFFVKNTQYLSMVKNENTKETGPFWAGNHGCGLQLWVKSLNCCSLRWHETEKAQYKAAMWCCQVIATLGIAHEPKNWWINGWGLPALSEPFLKYLNAKQF